MAQAKPTFANILEEGIHIRLGAIRRRTGVSAIICKEESTLEWARSRAALERQ